MQVLLSPALALVFLGASRWRRIGRVVASVVTVLFGYVIIVTYWEKLIPMYSGIEDRMTLKLLIGAYRHAPRLFAALGEVSLGPPAVIVGGSIPVTLLALFQMANFTAQLWRGRISAAALLFALRRKTRSESV
jgi:hypothetical protein